MVEEQVLKTSDQWLREDYPRTVILDHGGWDRRNFTYSFYQELITETEFVRRTRLSTITSW